MIERDLVWVTTTDPNPDFNQADILKDIQECRFRERELEKFWQALIDGSLEPGEVTRIGDLLMEHNIDPEIYAGVVIDNIATVIALEIPINLNELG